MKPYLQLLRTTFQNEVGRSKNSAAGQPAKQQLRPSPLTRVYAAYIPVLPKIKINSIWPTNSG